MNFITTLLGVPLGWIMWLCYQITHNYAVSLLFFTIVTRLIMVPFTIKQQKSTVKMQIIQPELAELQKKYANNKEKLNEEMMKLYQREGYSPMSGCLPMLIQFPILFGLIDVVYKPLTHILRIPADVIATATELVNTIGLENNARSNLAQLDIIKYVKNGTPGFEQAMGLESYNAVMDLRLNMFGIDLTIRPETKMFMEIFSNFNPVVVIPVLAGITSLLMSIVSMRNTSQPGGDNPTASSMKGMMYTMPVFSLFFTFSVPAGVGLYWIFSNLIGTVQSYLMNKFLNPKKAAEKARVESEERRERERLERIETKKKDPNKGLSQKEINRRKLAEARKRDAEKYGEEYVEVTESDLL